jgi:hypothetical protein
LFPICHDTSANLEIFAEQVEAGKHTSAIDWGYPLAGVPDVMHNLEADWVRGKIVVAISSALEMEFQKVDQEGDRDDCKTK